jgi:hypothetical protein
MAFVYKLTRNDGLAYIGITENLKKRILHHKRSSRFAENSLDRVEILFEGTYEECDVLEEYFINLHDTFKNGLNLTNRGKGKNLSDKFNTYGYKFSEVSKAKMSESAKNRTDRPTGYTHSADTKQKWSELRKGKVWRPIKIEPTKLIDEWNNFNPSMEDVEALMKFKGDVPKFKNGRPFSFIRAKLILFRNWKSKEYGVTTVAITRIISNAKLL